MPTHRPIPIMLVVFSQSSDAVYSLTPFRAVSSVWHQGCHV